MFAKKQDVSVRTDAVMKGKEQKTFKAQFCEVMGISEEALHAVVPAKAPCRRLKLASKCSVIAFELEGHAVPLPFAFYTDRVESAATLMPTVFALWAFPSALPCLITHAPVSRRLMGGADLFLAGVLVPPSGLPSYSAGARVAIRVSGNPLPFAVGIAPVSSADAVASGMEGTGVRVFHVFRDALWEIGGRGVPNPGFQQYAVVGLGGDEGGAESDEEEEEEAEVNEDGCAAAAAPSAEDGATEEEPEEDIGDDGVSGLADGVAAAAVTSSPGDASDADEGDAAAAAADSAPGMSPDDVLMDAFLRALKTRIAPVTDLPMLANTLYAAHVIPSRPLGTNINIKATKFKKFSTFLQAMSDEGVIGIMEADGVLRVMSVEKRHPLLSHYKAAGDSVATAAAAEADAAAVPKVEVSRMTVYHPSRPRAHELFQSVLLKWRAEGSNPDCNNFRVTANSGDKVVYDKAAVKQVVMGYVQKEGLQHPTKPAFVVLDPLLTDVLFPSPPAAGYPAELGKDVLFTKIYSSLTSLNVLRKVDGDVVVTSGAPKTITITEGKIKKRSASVFTSVGNLEVFGIGLSKTCSDLQRLCAASATIHDAGTDHATVAVQGAFKHQIARFLEAEYGIPSNMITIVSGSGGGGGGSAGGAGGAKKKK